MPTIDCHTHLFPPELIRDREKIAEREKGFSLLYGPPKARMVDATGLLGYMDAQGVNTSVACAFPYRDAGLRALANDYILEVARATPRVLPFIAVHLEEGRRARAETERYIQKGAIGVGEVAIYEKRLGRREAKGLVGIGCTLLEAGGILLLHVNEQVGHWYPGKASMDLAEIVWFVERTQGLRIILGHLGGGLCFYETIPEVRKAFSAVCYDTAAMPLVYSAETLRLAVGLAPEKILFGSDYPLLSLKAYGEALGKLSGKARGNVLHLNAERLFGKR
jgi:predicted TIM-barrel fold metal-dependent hydrolase